MAITLGTSTKLDDGVFSGTLKTLNLTASLTIVPVDKMSDNAPDHRLFAGQRYEIGAGWSQVTKSRGETYLPQPQDRGARVRGELAALPGGQARAPGRGRRYPHRTVGAARPLTAMPRCRPSAAGLPLKLPINSRRIQLQRPARRRPSDRELLSSGGSVDPPPASSGRGRKNQTPCARAA